MTRNELEQQLWELEYGLLPDDEAAALRDRLATDPELTTLQERVRSRREWVAHAARIVAPPMAFDVAPKTPRAVPPSSAPKQFTRLANWCMALAASLLVGLLAWNAIPEQRREVAVAITEDRKVVTTESVFLKIDAPAKLTAETTNFIGFRAASAEGSPQAAELEVRLLDRDGKQVGQKYIATDRRGRSQLGLSRQELTDVAQAQVHWKNAAGPTVNLDFGHSEPAFATHLVTDKPRYHPGDTVRFRSTTLTRFGLRAEREHEVVYRVTDPNGQELAMGKQTVTTQTGVASGDIVLTEPALHGRYSLFAASPGTVPEVRRDFDVTIDSQREYDLDVRWGREHFAAGETAVGELLVKKLDGQPAANENFELRGYVDGLQAVVEPVTATLDAEGKSAVRVTLPDQIASTAGDIGIVVAGKETVWQEIPLRANQAQVELYPEGGDLVANVENRVYFSSHDQAGKPVAMRGRLLESGQPIAELQTAHAGRGTFRFTPAAGLDYSIAVDDPPGIQSTIAVPSVATNTNIVLDAGAGVFAEKQPLTVELRAGSPPQELIVAAYCRGVTVGQQSIAPADFSAGRCNVTIPIADDAAGVLRVTVFDYAKLPPEPVAERLVYRRPAKKLAVRWDDAVSENANTMSLGLQIVDEANQPQSVVLGLAVIDDAVLREAKRLAPRIDAQLLLLGDVDHPEQLEDANFYISEQADAGVALDLLLGTQGWRRFERIPASRLAQVDRYKQEQLAYRQVELQDAVGGLGGSRRRTNEGDFKLHAFAADADLFFAEVVDEAPRRIASAFVTPVEQQLGRSVTPADRSVAPQLFQRRPGPWLNAVVGGALGAILLIAACVRWRPRRRIWLPALIVVSLLGGLVFWMSNPKAIQPTVSGLKTDRSQSSAPAERRIEFSIPLPESDSTDLPKLNEQESVAPAAQGAPPAQIADDAARLSGAAEKPDMLPANPTDPVDRGARPASRAVAEAPAAPARATIDKLPAPKAPPPPGAAASAAQAAPVASPKPLVKKNLERDEPLQELLQKEKLVRRFAFGRDESKDVREKSVAETRYWNPRLITDANGRAVISFPSATPARSFRVLLDAHHDGRVLGVELTK